MDRDEVWARYQAGDSLAVVAKTQKPTARC